MIRVQMCVCFSIFITAASTDSVQPGRDDYADVGSVLFPDRYGHDECWTGTDRAFLHARMMARYLMPNTVAIEEEKVAEALVRYYNLAVGWIHQHSSGEASNMMTMAFVDMFGGYLKVYGWPQVKKSYYAGFINYQKAKQVASLVEKVKNGLDTDGDAWRQPPQSYEVPLVLPLEIEPVMGNEDVCGVLILYRYGYPQRYTRQPFHHFTIPMPFLDSNFRPRAIALPFLGNRLVSLDDPSSPSLLVNYYVTATRCMQATGKPKAALRKFNSRLHGWLVASVLPHLADDDWFPAFGGVFRILAAMQEFGLEIPRHYRRHKHWQQSHSVLHIHGNQNHPRQTGNSSDVIFVENDDAKALLLYAIVPTFVCLFLMTVFFWCIRQKIRSRSSEVTVSSEETSVPGNTYFNTFLQILYNLKGSAPNLKTPEDSVTTATSKTQQQQPFKLTDNPDSKKELPPTGESATDHLQNFKTVATHNLGQAPRFDGATCIVDLSDTDDEDVTESSSDSEGQHDVVMVKSR